MHDPTRDTLRRELVESMCAESADASPATDETAGDERQRQHLDATLQRLERALADVAPPPGLAQRTCQHVAAQTAGSDHCPDEGMETAISEALDSDLGETGLVTKAPRRKTALRPDGRPVGDATSSFRLADLLMMCAVLTVAAFLAIPAILQSRSDARIAACQDNLRELGTQLATYSATHEGYFPELTSHGPVASAGLYAPILLDNGLLPDIRRVVCPGSELADSASFGVPSVAQLHKLHTLDQDRWSEVNQTMGGSYAYHLGHVENGVYRDTWNQNRPSFAIMADSPIVGAASSFMAHHDGRGYNALFEDGHVEFLTTPVVPKMRDNLFRNDDGDVGPGVTIDDAVLAPSGATVETLR